MLFRRNATASRSTAGFVLVEVLVAVGIAGVLMAVLIRSFSATWSGIGFVREEAEGTLLARSMLSDALQRTKLTPGAQEGTIGRYAWKLTTIQTPIAVSPSQKPQGGGQDGNPPKQQPKSSFYHVVLVLVGPSGRSNRLDAYEIGQPAQ
jgi:type II secretory pathway pseudopilin PulG